MQIFSVKAEAKSPITFSTIYTAFDEATIAPLKVIHNYPLMYGLAGYSAEILVSQGKEEKPTYSLILEIMNELYATPAYSENFSCKLFSQHFATASRHYGTMEARPAKGGKERAGFIVGDLERNIPILVRYYSISPSSTFNFLLLTRSEDCKLPRLIRVGIKREGTLKLSYEELKQPKFVSLKSKEIEKPPFNEKDVEGIIKVQRVTKVWLNHTGGRVISALVSGTLAKVDVEGVEIHVPFPKKFTE